MSDHWDYQRSAAFIARLRDDIARYGEPLASNIELDEIDPAKFVNAGAGGIVITEDEHLVFVRRTDLPDGQVGLMTPGGGSEPGEAPSATFVREVLEETGLQIEVDTLAIVYAIDGRYEPDWADDEIGVIVLFVGYARGGRLNDCVAREDDIAEAVAIRCDEVDPASIWTVLDRLLVQITACGPPEITRAALIDQFTRLGRRWPPILEYSEGVSNG